MSNKKIINKVFDQEFDIDTMRNQILLKKKEKEKNSRFKVLKYVIPACMIGIISGLLLFNNTESKLSSDYKEEQKYKNYIVVNKLDSLGATRLDADIKQMSTDKVTIPWLKNLTERINIPSDLDKSNTYAIYTRKDQNSDYNNLNCHVYNYFNEDSYKNIRIAFSEVKKPIRDYHFSEESAKKSNINNTELFIYQYENIYFTEFKYKDYNFDIETNDISIEELKLLLESILRQ